MTAGVPIGAFGSTYIGYKDNGQIPNLYTVGKIMVWYNNTANAWSDGPIGAAAASGTAWSLASNQGYQWTRPGDFNAAQVSSVYISGVQRVRPAGTGMPYIIKY